MIGDSQDTARALYTSIHGLPKDWRRRPRRPRRTWLRTMEADLQPLNHGLNSAWRLSQDRGRWKQLVEMATLQSGACPRWWWWWWIQVIAWTDICLKCRVGHKTLVTLMSGWHGAQQHRGFKRFGLEVAFFWQTAANVQRRRYGSSTFQFCL